jgi:hypothetical protein
MQVSRCDLGTGLLNCVVSFVKERCKPYLHAMWPGINFVQDGEVGRMYVLQLKREISKMWPNCNAACRPLVPACNLVPQPEIKAGE